MKIANKSLGKKKGMTLAEMHVRSMPAHKQPFLWKYVIMAEKLVEYRKKKK